MKLIIDIPEELYDWIEHGFPDEDDYTMLWKKIRQGTSLPEEHGRLIDVDELINKCAYDLDNNFVIDLIDVKEAPTIVEANKGE